MLCLEQSVANDFSEVLLNMYMSIIHKRHILKIWIWIIFLTPCVTNMNKNIICKKIFKKYIQIFEYIQLFENTQIPGYCSLPI